MSPLLGRKQLIYLFCFHLTGKYYITNKTAVNPCILPMSGTKSTCLIIFSICKYFTALFPKSRDCKLKAILNSSSVNTNATRETNPIQSMACVDFCFYNFEWIVNRIVYNQFEIFSIDLYRYHGYVK